MQTVKTAIVVVLLATVVYSAWVALTAPPADLPPELSEIVEGRGVDFNLDDIDIGLTDEGPEVSAAETNLADSSMAPPSLFADSGSLAGDSASSNRPTPPTLPASESVAGASDFTPPSLALKDSAGSNSLRGFSDSASTNTSTRLSDSNPTSVSNPASAPGTNFGFEIPARPQGQNTASAPDALAINTVPAASTPNSFASPAGFQLPGNNAADNFATNSSGGGTASSLDSDSVGASLSDNMAMNRTALANAIATADRQQQQDQLREALTTLSLFYNTPSLGQEERAAMLSRLDFLAGEVIYSQRHLLEQPYRVSSGESLQSIAQSLDVPWQLLATINQVTDPARVFPGQELKVVRGPFRAEVNLARSEMTLMLGELYAGRIPFSSGNDPAPQPGDYQVHDKKTDRTYYSLNGGNIPAGDDRNPYGDIWLDLGNNMSIHGTGRATSSSELGCIRLSSSDARDVYNILSTGSSVTIVR